MTQLHFQHLEALLFVEYGFFFFSLKLEHFLFAWSKHVARHVPSDLELLFQSGSNQRVYFPVATPDFLALFE